jgi:hypothetical protein
VTPANNVIGGMQLQLCATGSIGNWGLSSTATVDGLTMLEAINPLVRRAFAYEISGQCAVYVPNVLFGPPKITGSPSKTITLEYPGKVNCTTSFPAGYDVIDYQAA